MANNSKGPFERTVARRYHEFKDAVSTLTSVFAKHGKCDRKEPVKRVLKAGNDLLDILAEPDRPDWLHPIIGIAKHYERNSNDDVARSLLQTLIDNAHRIEPIALGTSGAGLLDFDAIYAELRETYAIPALFDKLIAAATEMIEKGDIDSLTATQALKSMSEVLKANRNRSYVAQVYAFDYAKFGYKFVSKFVQRIPVLAEAVAAFEETQKETQDTFDKIDQDLHNKTVEAVLLAAPRLKELATVKQGALPAPSRESDGVEEADWEMAEGKDKPPAETGGDETR